MPSLYSSQNTQHTPQKILHNVFGYDSFRFEQEAIIKKVMSGGDALAVMPTGGGKSLCYQIPALLLNGVGVVISPLIALMHDQVEALRQHGVAADSLNSAMPYREQQKVEYNLRHGQCDVLYIAPERLLMPRILDMLSHCHCALFAIDEAHCVSQWGHDFRPEYARLSVLSERFVGVPRIALTATADERTRQDILANLNMPAAQLFISGFDRPNICYRVEQQSSQRQLLAQFIANEHAGQAGIVYCLSRKKTEKVATWLQKRNFTALPYHAGMSSEQRREHQNRFLHDDGVIMVATIAFGMGIDKPNVRFVAHLSLPKSIEAYYQETGRAGRDGLPANAWMCYGLNDVVLLQQMLKNSDADVQHRRVVQQKLNAMLAYCEQVSCRRQTLLRYFGESGGKPCGLCDTCLQPVKTWDASIAAQKAMSCVYRTGQRFGVGHLIDVLLGKQTARISQLKHNQVSTYGIGSEYSGSQWQSIYRQLIAQGLLEVDEYSALRLHPSSKTVLRGEQKLHLRHDTISKISSTQYLRTKRAHSSTIDNDLWLKLRSLRASIAQQENVPPYIIFYDNVLKSICEKLPKTDQDLLAINGIGIKKQQKYGQIFLNAIGKHIANTTNTAKNNEHKHSKMMLSDTALESFELLQQANSPEAIAIARSLKVTTIYNHLAQAIKLDLLEVTQIIKMPASEIAKIEKTIIQYSIEGALKPVFDALDERYNYCILRCIMAGMTTG